CARLRGVQFKAALFEIGARDQQSAVMAAVRLRTIERCRRRIRVAGSEQCHRLQGQRLRMIGLFFKSAGEGAARWLDFAAIQIDGAELRKIVSVALSLRNVVELFECRSNVAAIELLLRSLKTRVVR